MKTCSKCRREKPLNEFYRDALKKDGYQYTCKSCKTPGWVDPKKRKTLEGRKFIQELLREGYFPQFQETDYETCKTPMLVLCPNGSEWKVRQDDFIQVDTKRPRKHCPCCRANKKPEFRKSWKVYDDLEMMGFIPIGNFETMGTPMFGMWEECGHYAYQRPKCVMIGNAACMTCYNDRR